MKILLMNVCMQCRYVPITGEAFRHFENAKITLK